MTNLNKEASGAWLIQKMLEGIQYAGTNTKQELVELEKNLSQLLQLRMYPFSYIEKYLMSQGYPQHEIRNAYRKITGIAIEKELEEDYLVMTVPGSIPQINMGWGPAKGTEYEYIFAMPWLVGYAVFGQKGDTDRCEIQRFDLLEDARDYVRKHVKEYHQFDKVLEPSEKKHKGGEFNAFSEPKFAKLSEQGMAVYDYVKYVGGGKADKRNSKYIKDAYFNGLLSKEDFTILASKFVVSDVDSPESQGPAVDDQEKALADLEAVESEIPVEEELKENSPDDFLMSQTREDGVQDLNSMTSGITKYLEAKVRELQPEYSLTLKSLKYIPLAQIRDLEQNVTTHNSRPDEPLSSTGVMAVLLNLQSAKLRGPENAKTVMMTFSLQRGEIKTRGVFKDSRGVIYEMGKSGIEKYFSEIGMGGSENDDITEQLFK